MKTASNWLENAIFKIRQHDLEIARNETAILNLLLEIETRKEYSEAGFDGLFSFCVRALGWSESQTATRTQAMYALRSVPELQEKLDSGQMTITTVAQVQRLIRQEQVEAGIKRTPEEKREFFSSFEGKTAAEVKEEIADRKGIRLRRSIVLELDDEADQLWTQVCNQAAHQTQGSALNCLKILMRSFLEKGSRSPSTSDSRRTTSWLEDV